jgi:hypothetical protein
LFESTPFEILVGVVFGTFLNSFTLGPRQVLELDIDVYKRSVFD